LLILRFFRRCSLLTIKTDKGCLKLNYAVNLFECSESKAKSEDGEWRHENYYADCRELEDGGRTAIFAIAKGRGEYNLGAARTASEAAIQECKSFFKNYSHSGKSEVEETLRSVFESANRAIYAKEKQMAIEMGSSLTIVLLVQNEIQIGHVGNSRVYHLTEEGLEQITVDQSLIIQPLEITGSQAGIRKVITRELGGEELPPPSFYSVELKPGDRILFCSNGLTSTMSDENISEILESGRNPGKTCEQLIDHAELRGADGNITVILADVKKDTGKKPYQGSPLLGDRLVFNEKTIKVMFIALLLIIVASVLALFFKNYFTSRLSGANKAEPRFTLISKARIDSFEHNRVDKTRFLQKNSGFIKLKNDVNRFNIYPRGIYQATLSCDQSVDVGLSAGQDNEINIDGDFIGINAGYGVRVTVKKPGGNKSGQNRTVIILRNLEGNLKMNMLVPVNTMLKIE